MLATRARAEEQRRQIQQRQQRAAGIAARPRVRPLGEHQREVQEQRRQHQHRHDVAPVEDPIERVEPAAEREGEHAEEGDAQPEEVQRRLMIRAAQPDRRADEQREDADRRQREVERAAVPTESAPPRRVSICCDCSRRTVYSSRSPRRAPWKMSTRSSARLHRPAVDRDQHVAGAHARPGAPASPRRRRGRSGLRPGHARARRPRARTTSPAPRCWPRPGRGARPRPRLERAVAARLHAWRSRESAGR